MPISCVVREGFLVAKREGAAGRATSRIELELSGAVVGIDQFGHLTQRVVLVLVRGTSERVAVERVRDGRELII
ncbi:MAG: hypothetical protein ACK6A7_10955 [Planctomycetota bacterium]